MDVAPPSLVRLTADGQARTFTYASDDGSAFSCSRAKDGSYDCNTQPSVVGPRTTIEKLNLRWESTSRFRGEMTVDVSCTEPSSEACTSSCAQTFAINGTAAVPAGFQPKLGEMVWERTATLFSTCQDAPLKAGSRPVSLTAKEGTLTIAESGKTPVVCTPGERGILDCAREPVSIEFGGSKIIITEHLAAGWTSESSFEGAIGATVDCEGGEKVCRDIFGAAEGVVFPCLVVQGVKFSSAAAAN